MNIKFLFLAFAAMMAFSNARADQNLACPFKFPENVKGFKAATADEAKAIIPADIGIFIAETDAYLESLKNQAPQRKKAVRYVGILLNLSDDCQFAPAVLSKLVLNASGILGRVAQSESAIPEAKSSYDMLKMSIRININLEESLASKMEWAKGLIEMSDMNFIKRKVIESNFNITLSNERAACIKLLGDYSGNETVAKLVRRLKSF